MITYGIRDLHLHDDDQPYLYTHAKEAVLTAVADEALAEPDANFVLAGDAFDLTGMTPPLRGVRDFFERTLPAERVAEALYAAGTPRDAGSRMLALAARFPRTFASLGRLAQAGRLVIVPGDHDWEGAWDAHGRHALAQILGVPERALPVQETYCVDGLWVRGQGPGVPQPGSATQRGQIMAGALFRVLMPALRLLGLPEPMVQAIPAVRPEERVIDGIEAVLPQEESDALLRALTQLLWDNGYFVGLGRAEVWLALRALPGVLTAQHMREHLGDHGELHAVFGAQLTALDETRYAGRGKRVQLMQRGGEGEAARPVNLGSWVDHVRGLLPAELARRERALPILRAADGEVVVYDLAPFERTPGLLIDAPRLVEMTLG